MEPEEGGGLNAVVADALRDFAETIDSPSKWGYKRAASTVRGLDVPIDSLVRPDGTLDKIPNIGPASSRIILEILQTGRSTIVDEAVARTGKTELLEARQRLRVNFLTRAQALRILKTPAGQRLVDRYHGDLQMHSTWSDGSQTLDEIVESRLARGYTYSAITDHSYGLAIAGGVSMAELQEQHQEIDALNRRYGSTFRLLKGIEANIRADGSVDMQPEELRQLEIVIAAPHSVLRSPHDQTARVLAAIQTPGVHILGHGRGRMYGSRPGLQVRWPEVFVAAARLDVAIEVDGDPARQDLDFTLARDALAAGCVLAVDTDAHSVADMRYVDLALAHAAKAGATPDRVINCWDVNQLLQWSTRAWCR